MFSCLDTYPPEADYRLALLVPLTTPFFRPKDFSLKVLWHCLHVQSSISGE
ncbi:MAG: hypothetical protein AAB048_03115 [Planctomycetota bacterium]